MLKKENAVVKSALKPVLALFQDRPRGATVTYAEMEKAAGFGRESDTDWKLLVKKIKREVRKTKGQELRAEPNVGYRIQSVREQIILNPIREVRIAGRRIHRSGQSVKAVPIAELTDHMRQVQARVLDQGKAARRAALYASRVGHALAKTSGKNVPRPR